MRIRRRKSTFILLGLVAFVAMAIPSYERIIGTSLTVKFGGTVWIPISERTPFLSKGVTAALQNPPPAVSAGKLTWQKLREGFAVGDLPVMADGQEVDRILLARIDPARFRFVIHNDPSGSKPLGSWMRTLDAVLVVNGSYYGRAGGPATPTIIDGTVLGPDRYDANHGAFIADDRSARIADLQTIHWKSGFEGARNAFVSYPLLLARDGSSRVPREKNWLANRSFVAEDRQGRIVIGTTRDGFFSLSRLAAFLKAAPLDLAVALNLDGGPVACQGVRVGDFRRRSCGNWEVQVKNGQAKMLPPLWIFSDPPLPVVLAVYPKP